jgi:tetratricopeptide (TPR) repeat protein
MSIEHFGILLAMFVLTFLITTIVDITGVRFFSTVFFLKDNIKINKGENANYYASVIPLVVALLFEEKKYRGSKLFICVLIASCITGIYIVIKSGARIAILGMIIGAVYVFFRNERIKKEFNNIFGAIWRKRILLGSILIFSVCIGKFVYEKNPESIKGRFLIYEVSASIIEQNPLFGIGPEGVKKRYNLFQSNYIKTHNLPMAKRQLADNSYFAFNEFISVAVEFGVIGLIIICIGIYCILYLPKNHIEPRFQYIYDGAIGAVLAVLVCALFSYPLHSLSVLVNVVFYLAIISTNERKTFNCALRQNIATFIFILGTGICGIFSIKEFKRYTSLMNWEKAAHLAHVSRFNRSEKLYIDAHHELLNDGSFLYNYGAELFKSGRYNESLSVLKRATLTLCNTDLYIYLGDNYKMLGDFENAKHCYEIAEYIQPSKFSPKIRLLLLYQDFGQSKSAVEIAKEIREYPVKVPSSVVDGYKNYANEFLSGY